MHTHYKTEIHVHVHVPIFNLFAGRLIPAARVEVHVITYKIFSRYASSINLRSSAVNPTNIHTYNIIYSIASTMEPLLKDLQERDNLSTKDTFHISNSVYLYGVNTFLKTRDRTAS